MIIKEWNKLSDSDSIIVDSSTEFKKGEKWETPDKEELMEFVQNNVPSLHHATSKGSVKDLIIIRGKANFDEADENKLLEMSKQLCKKYGCANNQIIIKDPNGWWHKSKHHLNKSNFSLIMFGREISVSTSVWK